MWVTCPQKCPRSVRSTSAAADIWNIGTVCLKIESLFSVEWFVCLWDETASVRSRIDKPIVFDCGTIIFAVCNCAEFFCTLATPYKVHVAVLKPAERSAGFFYCSGVCLFVANTIETLFKRC